MSSQAKTVTLSEEERRRLARIDDCGSDWREGRRARTLLLLDQGLSIDAAVAQQRIHRETVACHRDARLARSFQRLRDLPRSGAPRKLSETHKQALCAWAKKKYEWMTFKARTAVMLEADVGKILDGFGSGSDCRMTFC